MWILIPIGIVLVCVAGYLLLTGYKKGPGDPNEYIDQIQEQKISPNMNRFAAGREGKAATARAATAVALNQEAQAVTELHTKQAAAIQAEYDRSQAELRAEERRKLEQAAHDNQMAIIQDATPLRLTSDALVEANKKKLMDEYERLHQSKDAIDRIRLGIIAKYLKEHQEIIELQVILDQLYETVHRIEISNEPEAVKRRKIAAREESIRAIEEDKRGREARLLQSYQRREELGEGNPDSLLLGDTEE